ncbi:hypothetical protein I4U23_022123 [Adineta vaga]|nr:hypothetical protein I4U23_022123 [Adineta vaga]
MGAFLLPDVVNMNESPLSLLGDQTTINSIDPVASFLELGYVWNDNSLVRPPSSPRYCFDYSTNKDPNIADGQRIEKEACKATEQHNLNLG